MTKSRGTATANHADWEFVREVPAHAGDEKTLHEKTQAMGATKTIVLLLLSPITGLLYVLAFPAIGVAAVIRAAWVKRKEYQIRMERKHSRTVAFLLSFARGLLYVAFSPLIIIGALIKKLALERMERQEA